MNKQLKQYEEACNDLAEAFMFDFLEDGDELKEGYSYWWIGDEIGGVLFFQDMHLSIEHMTDYFRAGCTPEQFINWYWYELEQYQKGENRLTLRNYIISSP